MSAFIDINDANKQEYNDAVSHPLQSFEWGEFRKKTGVKVIRRGLIHKNKIIDGFTLTLHKVPSLPFFIGYLPKGNNPSEEVIQELTRIGKENNCIYIQLEPNILEDDTLKTKRDLTPSFHPLFTKYTFVLDMTPSEEELLKNMHQKTRYNIKVARKHEVVIKEEHSDQAFNRYLQLTEETTKRQGFFAHTPPYHKKMWATLKTEDSKIDTHALSAHLFTASVGKEIITTWIVFVFQDTLYYPYGASSRKNRETMASNLMMWEVIRYGKALGLKHFDMWGALGPSPNTQDPWYGFHRFKEGYGGKLTSFVGSYDLVIDPLKYQLIKVADKVRWAVLRFKK